MRQLTHSEKHNFEWLKSTLEKDSGYTSRFQRYAFRDMKRLEAIFQI